MRKIRDGLIALAILGGPALIILAHQKLMEPWPQEASNPAAVTTRVQRASSRCAAAPQSDRPSPCDDAIWSVDQCTVDQTGCDPRSVSEAFRKRHGAPAQPDNQPPTRPL